MYSITSLGEIANVTTGYPFKGNLYSDEGVRVVRGENITVGSLRWDSIKCWNSKFEQTEKYSLKEDDVVIGMDGSRVGKNRAQIKARDLPLLLAQRVACVRSTELSDQNYLFYLIRSEKFEQYVNKIQTGSSIPHISLRQIEEFPVAFPPLSTQQKIASVLSVLDSKIELNNRINAELEAMAKTLYDYWFVQFDFPISAEQAASMGKPQLNGKPYKTSGGKMVWNEELKREIPEGWEVKLFGDVVAIKNGRDHKHLNKGNYPVYGSGGIMRKCDTFLYDSESILIPRKGSLGNLFYINEPFWCVDTIFYTQMKIPQSCKYLFYTTQNFNIAKMNTGTAVPSMTTEILNNLTLIFPPSNILKSFDDILTPIFKKKSKTKIENQELTELRDWLLPMLMNGQVKVSER